MTNTKLLIDALQKIVDMNRQEAIDKWGDADKAELFSCYKVAAAALASYAEQAPPAKGPWHIREEESRCHPESGDMSVDVKSTITDGKAELITYDDGDLQPIVDALNASECKFRADDAARLELFNLSHEVAELRRWKKEAMEVYLPIHEYAEGHPSIKLGASIVAFVVDRAIQYDKTQNQVTGKSAGVSAELIAAIKELMEKLPSGNGSQYYYAIAELETCRELVAKYESGEAGKQPEQVELLCMVCGKSFMGELPQMCCSGQDCGCMGMPVDPVVCSKECYNNLPHNISKRQKESKLPEQQPAEPWISIDKHKPAFGQLCDIWIKAHKNEPAHRRTDYQFVSEVGVNEEPAFQPPQMKEAGLYEMAFYLSENLVTHWMPRPSAPGSVQSDVSGEQKGGSQ
ncbi:MAG: hypothetical protein ACTHMC_09845 [Pseudobacter sp.]|uniref:hypothetical protein n=1 Tax=Pseudobacter sp. TaxID=2045420 RepID=UPI003F815CE6